LPSFTYCESENLYNSDDRDDTARHSVLQLIPPSPDALTTSIAPSAPTLHRSMEVPPAPRTTSVVNRTTEPPKKGSLLVIKPRVFSGFIDDNGRQQFTGHIEPTTRSDHEIVQQAIVRHEYAVAGQSETVPTNHTEPRRSKRDGKGQWHSALTKNKQNNFRRKNNVRMESKRWGALCAYGLPEIPRARPVPGLISSALQ
jgi:hypothetical protein